MDPAYRCELVNISKSFGGISALKDVTLRIRAGKIHALAGENGAGKSTLMKILSGASQKDSGRIIMDQKEVHIRNTLDSKKLGIGIIYQELSLVPELSVAENIFLSRMRSGGFWVNWAKLKKEAVSIIRNIGFDINPSVKVRKLSIAHQQIVEIAKALSENVQVLILDEPSAVLGPYEIKKLFQLLDRLKDEGVAIIYITHHLEEIFRLADEVTVLKDGIAVDSRLVSESSKEMIIKHMLGRPLETMFPDHRSKIGKEVFRAVSIIPAGQDEMVSLSLKEGEILGIAGLVGSGRTEWIRSIFAADQMEKGEFYLNENFIRIKSPHQAVIHGIGMVPENRKEQGVVISLSLKQNISLTNFKDITHKLGFINRRKELEKVRSLIQKLSIKTINENQEVGNLSGGNQQKVALAKWMARKCQILLIDEPTRGVDIGAKVEIYRLINELSSQGTAIIVVSSETQELMGLCDRILVMRKGKIQGELNRHEFTEEKILRLSLGAG